MIKRAWFAALGVAGIAAFSSTAGLAQPMARPAIQADKASPLLMKRQAVQGVHADAMAVLNALEKDPALASELVAKPEQAQALLRARGATRADTITVIPVRDGTAQKIKITIKIDHVTIEIIL